MPQRHVLNVGYDQHHMHQRVSFFRLHYHAGRVPSGETFSRHARGGRRAWQCWIQRRSGLSRRTVRARDYVHTTHRQPHGRREFPTEPPPDAPIKLTCIHPGGRLKALGCRVLAERRHPRVLCPRFLPEVVEVLHLLLLSAHGLCYWWSSRSISYAEPKLTNAAAAAAAAAAAVAAFAKLQR